MVQGKRHLLVQRSHSSSISDFSSEREEEATWVREKMPPPSDYVKSASQLTEVFTKGRLKFHCGRPMGNYGPSVSLFNRVLGLVAYWANHLDDDDILTKDLFLDLQQEARQEMVQVEHEVSYSPQLGNAPEAVISRGLSTNKLSNL